MGKRSKKKILFDVFADSAKRSDGRLDLGRRRGGGKKSKPLMEGEFRLTYNFAAVLGLVFVGFIAFSYYIGTLHGQGRTGNEGLRLAKDASTGGAATAEAEAFWAVKALSRDYTPYTSDEILAHFTDCVQFFIDEGFPKDDVFVFDVPGERDGEGEFVLWVGRADTREGLADAATKIRKLVYKRKQPFLAAHVAWFETDGS